MPLPPFLATPCPPQVDPGSNRLEALYIFTRAQRDANPDGYQYNVMWWSDALIGSLESGWAGALSESGRDVLVLTVDDALLDRVASASGQRPKGLGGVVESMTLAAKPVLMVLSRYNSLATPVDNEPSISSRLISAGWSLMGRLLPFGSTAESPTEVAAWKSVTGNKYVDLEGVRQASRHFSGHIKANPPLTFTDSLYTRAAFHKEFSTIATPREVTGSPPLSRADTDVLLRWLERDAGLVVVDGDIIKILSPGQVPAEHPITEADRGAVAVTTTLTEVEKQITAVENQTTECTAKAKAQLAKGNRAAATSYLRSKKQLEDVLTKRIASGEQLRGVLRAIDQAKGDAEVMSAYEVSTKALSAALADPRLSPEHIADTTDALADALASQKEIDDAVQMGSQLAVAGSTAGDIDDDELAKELEDLVLEEKANQARQAEEAKAAAIAKAAAEAKAVAEAKIAAEAKAAAEKAEKEAKQKAEEARQRAAAARAESESTAGKDSSTEKDWAARHAEAQQREADEKARAEAERLAREERMVAAE